MGRGRKQSATTDGRAAKQVLLVGDRLGVPQMLRTLPDGVPVGIVGASNRPQYHDELARIAADCNLPLLIQPPWRSDAYPGFRRAATVLRPDLILCNSYSMTLPDDFLALARGGGVNVHGGKVPEYRGPNPLQWSIIRDEREAGVTIHHMTSEIDEGDVIAQRSVPIGFDDRWRAVQTRLAEETERLLAEMLPGILSGTAPRRPQPSRTGRVWPRRRPEDGRIDWGSSVLAIYNLIRALGDGLPPSFYEHRGRRMELDRFLSAAEVTALKFAPGPGGRALTEGRTMLVPSPGEFVRFEVIREGRRGGNCGLDEFDPIRRTARAWAEPSDTVILQLVETFARDELGLALREL
jgi:methionyl-tRNA formyltransferase